MINNYVYKFNKNNSFDFYNIIKEVYGEELADKLNIIMRINRKNKTLLVHDTSGLLEKYMSMYVRNINVRYKFYDINLNNIYYLKSSLKGYVIKYIDKFIIDKHDIKKFLVDPLNYHLQYLENKERLIEEKIKKLENQLKELKEEINVIKEEIKNQG